MVQTRANRANRAIEAFGFIWYHWCMKDTDLLSTSDAARMFAVTPSTIRRWAHSGRLSHMLTPSGRMRFRRADLEKACMTVTSDDSPDVIGEGPVCESR